MTLLNRLHERYVVERRIQSLARHLTEVLPTGARVLDVGCGDGRLTHQVIHQRPDLSLQGIDRVARVRTAIEASTYDGQTIPHADASFDVVMLIDTVHHAEEPLDLLREAVRVARRTLVVKDHVCEGWLAGPTLRLMDRVANARHSMRLPEEYWISSRWREVFKQLGLTVATWRSDLYLYPWPATCLFDRSLHFLACLDVPASRECLTVDDSTD